MKEWFKLGLLAVGSLAVAWGVYEYCQRQRWPEVYPWREADEGDDTMWQEPDSDEKTDEESAHGQPFAEV